MDVSTPEARLLWARSRLYDEAKQFADVLGINAVTYRAYESGQNGFAKHGVRFAAKLGVPVEWLLDGVGPEPKGAPPILLKAPDIERTIPADAGETADIIVLDLSLPMGPGAEIEDYIEETTMKIDIGLLRLLTRSPFHRLRILNGIGDSMEPTIGGGDLVIADTTYNRLDFEDKIWALRIRGLGAIKRLRSAPKRRVKIISDNPNIPNDTADEDDIAILGRIVGSIRRH